MARKLNLADIQGNVLRGYGLPKSRYIFLNVASGPEGREAGRAFVERVRERVTTALPWKSSQSWQYPPSPTGEELPPKPKVTLNLAFTFWGLAALGLPTETLRSMPAEFIDGMKKRAELLGDDFCSPARPHAARLDHWDPIWQNDVPHTNREVHIMVALNAQMNKDGTTVPELQEWTDFILGECEKSEGNVTVLRGHKPDNAPFQDGSYLLNEELQLTPKEHFGFRDGIGDPVFDGQYPDCIEMQEAVGGGKILPDQSWVPLATGEFLLGYPDEAQENPPASRPLELTHNGTFVAYRKLHQDVRAFEDYLKAEAVKYAKVMGLSDLEEAEETIAAKIVGRWKNGVPLMAAPTYAEWKAFNTREQAARDAAKVAKDSGNQAEISRTKQQVEKIDQEYVDFKYRTDPEGSRCPVSAHLRRANTRDMLDPTGDSKDKTNWNGSVINNRRRILRRGMPYGKADAPDGEHGVIFMAVCASLFRQFEFVQQQWMQYGLDFDSGNDTCPMIGNHGPEAKFVIPGDEKTKPYICGRLPQFVEVRGGGYFFIPSITALRMMAAGTIDPT